MLSKAINRDTMRKLALLSILIIGAISFSACATPSAPPAERTTPAPTPTPTPTTKSHIYTHGVIEVGGDGEPIVLINNPDATNPTYAELVAFIKTDDTDKYSYIFGPPKIAYVCSDFAEDVHNNAEVAGIRAAWVGIEIEGFKGKTKWHALTAFETTDLGLVYIDCTGKGIWTESSNRNSWDRRARVEIGKPYKVADIDRAKTRFKFQASTPYGYDGGYYRWKQKPKEETLRSLERLGWIGADTYEERHQKNLEQKEWLQSHNVEVLKQRWIQEWIRKYEAELSRCGYEFVPESYCGDFGGVACYSDIYTDCLEIPWFQPEEKLIEVDGIPIVWKVWQEDDWNVGWVQRLGVVKDIHIHW